MKMFENELEEFDVIIHKIFDFDVQVIANECVQLFGGMNLFSAHFLDILYVNGKLQLAGGASVNSFGDAVTGKYEWLDSTETQQYMQQQQHQRQQQLAFNSNNATSLSHMVRQQHLTEYATQLMRAAWSTQSLAMYQTAFDYLRECHSSSSSSLSSLSSAIEPTSTAVTGLELIETYLEKYPLTYVSEKDANLVFNMAFRLELHDTAFAIGRIMQTRAFKRGQYGTALSWNVRIKDPSFGTVVAEK